MNKASMKIGALFFSVQPYTEIIRKLIKSPRLKSGIIPCVIIISWLNEIIDYIFSNEKSYLSNLYNAIGKDNLAEN